MSKKIIRQSKGVASMAPGRRGFDAGADKVLAALELSGRTVSDLAQASGVSRVALSNWLNGRRPLRADYLLALLPELGLEIAPVNR